jgi:hypothetical protein
VTRNERAEPHIEECGGALGAGQIG